MDIFLDIKTAFLQEFILCGFIVFNIIASLFFGKNFYKFAKWLSILAITIAMGVSPLMPVNYYGFKDSFVANIYTLFFKNLILITAFFVVLLSRNMIKQKRNKAFEYFTLILTATVGAMCLVSANDFIVMFVAMEVLGVACYFLTAFSKNYESKEAGFKYLVMGSVATGIFLFGASYIYGFTNHLNFTMINDFYLKENPALVFTVASILVAAGLLFKIGAVPFANWIPDIYEGTSYPVGAFLSLIPKIAGFAVLGRLLVFIFSFSPILKIILATLAVISIGYGSLGALRQTNIKRLYGYSSIAQSGFILLGISMLSVYSLSTVLFYLFSYVFMNIGIWTAAITFNTSFASDKILDYKGLLYNRPYYAIAFTICLISLAGLPPTSGFIAKLYLFSGITMSSVAFLPALVFALIFAVVGLFFYFNLVKVLFEKTSSPANIDTSLISPKYILYACALITLLLCFFAEKIIQICLSAAYYI